MKREKKTRQADCGRIALVDVEIIAFQVVTETAEEECVGRDEWTWRVDVAAAFDKVEQRLNDHLRESGADAVLLAAGSPSNWRKRLWPEYKAGRPRKPLGYHALMEKLRKHHGVESVPWLEADDVIGLAHTAPGADTVVVSSDKDLRTVPGLLYNPDKPERGVEVIGRDAADLNHLVLALTGDSADGYKGAKGVGDVTARRALEGLATYGERLRRAYDLFREAGHDDEYATLQLRLARVLRHGEYDAVTGELKLWEPPSSARTSSPARSRTSGGRATSKPSTSGSSTSKGRRLVRVRRRASA